MRLHNPWLDRVITIRRSSRCSVLPPEHHKTIARHIADTWATKPRVEVWTAEGTPASQAIAILDNFPERGFRAYSTIGLSDNGGHEIVSLASMRNESFVKALFDLASFILDGHRRADAGATFEKLVSRYYSRCEAGHFLLTEIPLPGTQIANLRLGRRTIQWLYGWPITSDELLLTESKRKTLERLLSETSCATIADLNRSPLPGVPHHDPWGTRVRSKGRKKRKRDD